jgi:hypothetical protein
LSTAVRQSPAIAARTPSVPKMRAAAFWSSVGPSARADEGDIGMKRTRESAAKRKDFKRAAFGKRGQ